MTFAGLQELPANVKRISANEGPTPPAFLQSCKRANVLAPEPLGRSGEGGGIALAEASRLIGAPIDVCGLQKLPANEPAVTHERAATTSVAEEP